MSHGDLFFMSKTLKNIEYRFQNIEYRNGLNFIIRNSLFDIRNSIFHILPPKKERTLDISEIVRSDNVNTCERYQSIIG